MKYLNAILYSKLDKNFYCAADNYPNSSNDLLMPANIVGNNRYFRRNRFPYREKSVSFLTYLYYFIKNSVFSQRVLRLSYNDGFSRLFETVDNFKQSSAVIDLFAGSIFFIAVISVEQNGFESKLFGRYKILISVVHENAFIMFACALSFSAYAFASIR